MTRLTISSLMAWIAVCVAGLACVGAIPTASAAGSKTAEHVPKESLPVFEKQLAAGEVSSSAFRPKRHVLHVKLKDGRHLDVELAQLTPSLRKKLKSQGTLAAAKAPPHKLRYIVGGAVVVVVIVVLIALLVWRRRRRAALDQY